VTIHTMRAPGLTWFRLPLFGWGPGGRVYGTIPARLVTRRPRRKPTAAPSAHRRAGWPRRPSAPRVSNARRHSAPLELRFAKRVDCRLRGVGARQNDESETARATLRIEGEVHAHDRFDARSREHLPTASRRVVRQVA
jgi:hypothetical protein